MSGIGPQPAALLEQGRPGDSIHAHSLGRLAWSFTYLIELVETITERGATLVFHRQGPSVERGTR